MNRTAIDWCDFTYNPIFGCDGPEETGPCPYCYARALAPRIGAATGCELCASFTPHFHEERVLQPLRRDKPSIIFCGSMTDLFGKRVEQAWRGAVWAIVEESPQHTYCVLTKCPQNITLQDSQRTVYLDNLWVGVSAEDTARFDLRCELLNHATPHPWLSAEPLLGELAVWDLLEFFEWVVVGADSRRGAELPEAGWVTRLEEACEYWERPFFVKRNLAPVMGEAYIKAHQAWPEEMKSNG